MKKKTEELGLYRFPADRPCTRTEYWENRQVQKKAIPGKEVSLLKADSIRAPRTKQAARPFSRL